MYQISLEWWKQFKYHILGPIMPVLITKLPPKPGLTHSDQWNVKAYTN